MTRDQFLLACGFTLQVAGITEFRAYEISDVGRQAKDARGRVLATLKAPGPREVAAALKLAEVLVWLRAVEGEAPVDVSSWFRDTEYNRAIGGAAGSIHKRGGASDVNKRGWTPLRVALKLHRDHPRSASFGIGYYPPNPERGTKGFCHVDIRGMLGRPAPARWCPTGKAWWT